MKNVIVFVSTTAGNVWQRQAGPLFSVIADDSIAKFALIKFLHGCSLLV